ncbi:MAG: hypothetical protein HND47_14315 [Chloroflexi bacterium]|nr:hypothetical protein [Chloroflexota bacterium]
MKRQDVLSKSLAITGTILTWFPIFAPILLGVGSLIGAGVFRLDYLMPAELFPSALLGGGLLLWASLRAHAHSRLIGWGLGLAVFLLVGSQWLAEITGLASGETQPTPWLFALVLIPLMVYVLAVAAVGVGGILLTRTLFNNPAR